MFINLYIQKSENVVRWNGGNPNTKTSCRDYRAFMNQESNDADMVNNFLQTEQQREAFHRFFEMMNPIRHFQSIAEAIQAMLQEQREQDAHDRSQH